MHIHVINLDRTPDRLAEFSDLNRHLKNVSRFAAVDGRDLDLDALVRQGVATPDILDMYVSAGALGCAISSFALWDKAIASDEIVTVCDDDAIFNHGFEERAEEVLNQLPGDWDIIYWGFNFDVFMCFDVLPGVSPCVAVFRQEQLRLGIPAFQQQAISPRAFRLMWAFGLICYSISPKGARAIKSKILPLRPQVVPFPEAADIRPFASAWQTVGFDNTLNAVHREIESFVCFPPLVVAKNEHDKSTIQVT